MWPTRETKGYKGCQPLVKGAVDNKRLTSTAKQGLTRKLTLAVDTKPLKTNNYIYLSIVSTKTYKS